MRFTANEIATILHGLRCAQEQREGIASQAESCSMQGEACDHFDDDHPGLEADEIESLCERVNFEGAAE